MVDLGYSFLKLFFSVVYMIGFHIFPTLEVLPGTPAAFAPAVWSRKSTNVNTRSYTRFQFKSSFKLSFYCDKEWISALVTWFIGICIRQVSCEESSCLMVIIVSIGGQLVSWHRISATQIIADPLYKDCSMIIFLSSRTAFLNGYFRLNRLSVLGTCPKCSP